jgi:hypothetical protein
MPPGRNSTTTWVVGQFEFVLKGHGFQPCRNCRKINNGFSRWGNVSFKLTHYHELPNG